MEDKPATEETPDTEETSDTLALPASDTPAGRRVMWQWVGGLVGFAIAAAILGGLLFDVPYVALVPGSARDTEPLLRVEGLEDYPSDGELLLTTVRVRQRPNLWEYLWLQADGDTDVVAEELILDGRTPEENREFNLQLMNDSKEVAIAVALEELGYDAISSDGVIIIELVPGAAADGVLELGDTITAIDGRRVATAADLVAVLGDYAPGDEVDLTVERFSPEAMAGAIDQPDQAADAADEPEQTDEPDQAGDLNDRAELVTVELGAKEDDAEAAFLGVGPTDRIELIGNFDFDVDIDSGTVGGPSAGLAFTLAVLDQLTAGELTGGMTVAVTGTIDAGGRVGSVGGVVQKTAAVRDMGADVFIVPAALPEAELARVFDRAGDDLQIIPVWDLDEALEALGGLGGEVAAVEEFAAANLS